jgi:chromosome segregation ATPase
MPTRKAPALTEADLVNITKSFDALSEAVDALQAAVQRNAVDHATIKTKLEDVLGQLRSLAKTVSGDQGLVSRVSVLESRLKTVEADIEKKAQEIRQELNKEISDVRSAIDDLRKSREQHTQKELAEAKDANKTSRNYRLSVWGAVVSTLALAVTIVLFSLQNCQAKSAADPAPASVQQKAK